MQVRQQLRHQQLLALCMARVNDHHWLSWTRAAAAIVDGTPLPAVGQPWDRRVQLDTVCPGVKYMPDRQVMDGLWAMPCPVQPYHQAALLPLTNHLPFIMPCSASSRTGVLHCRLPLPDLPGVSHCAAQQHC
jgi:hypothetical protein